VAGVRIRSRGCGVVPCARATRTIRMCSLDARSEGPTRIPCGIGTPATERKKIEED
jgi:hypothetical protein